MTNIDIETESAARLMVTIFKTVLLFTAIAVVARLI